MEENITNYYQTIQKRINELEPGKLRAYNELLERQKDFLEQVAQKEAKLHEVEKNFHSIYYYFL